MKGWLKTFFIKRLLTSSLVIVCFFSSFKNLHAQRGKHWYFGHNAAMRFDNTGAVPLNNSAMYAEIGVANMSDTAGNLLFYSNGNTVWNRNHQPMQNGIALLLNGANGSKNCMALPMPGHDSLYYLFVWGSSVSNWIYHIINMNANAGLGSVTAANQLFVGNNAYLDCIAAISHANGRDYWLIISDFNDARIFHSYLISPNGISLQPVVSDFRGQIDSTFSPIGYVQLKPSPDGTMLVRGFTTTDIFFQLFRFNQTTGQLYQPIRVISSYYGSVCFSPDSKRVYCAKKIPTPHICQYTVANYTTAALALSAYDMPQYTTGTDMANGADGKLYINQGAYQSRLSGIANPNDSGPQLQYLDTAISLYPKFTSQYLPVFPNNINRTVFYLQPTIQVTDCRNYRFSFTHNLRGTTTHTWQFGDGTTSADSLANHTYNFTADSVQFMLTVANADTTLVRQQWLYLPKKPLVNFTATTQGCANNPVLFSGTVMPRNNAPIDSIRWALGDGSLIQQQNQFIHQYSDTGTYSVSLWAKDSLGCRSDTLTRLIAVNKKLVGGFGLPQPGCNNTATPIIDSSYAFNTTVSQWKYFISTGDSIVSNTSGNQVYFTPNTGTYTIRQVAFSPEGCRSDTVSRSFTVYPKPTARFGLPQNCVLDRSLFTDSSTAPAGSSITGWKWHFGDANASPANPDSSLLQNPAHQYSQAATYNVQLIAASQQGCSDTLSKSFTVNGSQPQALFSFSPGQRFCSSDSIHVLNNSSINFGSIIRATVYWSATDSNSYLMPGTGSLYAHLYPVFGLPLSQITTIRLKVQSGTNCISQKDSTILIYAQPKVSFLPLPTLCSSADAIVLNQGTIINNTNAVASYTGNGVGYNAATNQYQLDPAGLPANSAIIINYKAVTAYGCADSVVQTIRILPLPMADAGPSKTILEGGSTVLNASASGTGLTYQWLPAIEINDATLLNPVATVTASRTYVLMVTNRDGCHISDSMRVTVLKSLVIPNAFSPNGDGINDKWVIAYLNTYITARVTVFDRYGRQVFNSSGYAVPWDGTSSGKPLPAGTYYYIIYSGSGRQPVNGPVTILR